MNEHNHIVAARCLLDVGIVKEWHRGTYAECLAWIKAKRHPRPAEQFAILYPNGREASWVLPK